MKTELIFGIGFLIGLVFPTIMRLLSDWFDGVDRNDPPGFV